MIQRSLLFVLFALALGACPGDGNGGSTAGAVCGNAVVETGEECDDGNLTGGDGCSATCRSEQTDADGGPVPQCGDDIVQDGEVCDDGNETGGDGCAADCLSDEPHLDDPDARGYAFTYTLVPTGSA